MGTFTLVTQFLVNLLLWIGIFLTTKRANISAFQKRFVQITSAVLLFSWFAAFYLLAENSFFRTIGGIPLAVFLPLILGFSLFFLQTFRKILTATPMHWIVGFQVYRVIGFMFFTWYIQGLLPGIVAFPAGIGDVLTGITAPLVAYWFYKNGKNARLILDIWNSFGILETAIDLTLGALAQTALLKTEPTAALLGVTPIVWLSAFAVPRSLLLHGYTFLLFRKKGKKFQI